MDGHPGLLPSLVVHDPEGVIKFRSHHRDAEIEADARVRVRSLAGWRRILRELGVLGREPHRYDGLAFGNLSARMSLTGAASNAFVISGGQTSGLDDCDPLHFAVVERHSLADNCVWSHGRVLPSSESMTHAAVYELDPDIAYVFHVHAPALWRASAALGLLTTAAEVPYGTPAMASEVQRTWHERMDDRPLIVMLGHEDGVIAFGKDADTAGGVLVQAMAAAWEHAHG